MSRKNLTSSTAPAKRLELASIGSLPPAVPGLRNPEEAQDNVPLVQAEVIEDPEDQSIDVGFADTESVEEGDPVEDDTVDLEEAETVDPLKEGHDDKAVETKRGICFYGVLAIVLVVMIGIAVVGAIFGTRSFSGGEEGKDVSSIEANGTNANGPDVTFPSASPLLDVATAGPGTEEPDESTPPTISTSTAILTIVPTSNPSQTFVPTLFPTLRPSLPLTLDPSFALPSISPLAPLTPFPTTTVPSTTVFPSKAPTHSPTNTPVSPTPGPSPPILPPTPAGELVQMGQTLLGQAQFEQFGWFVAISGDGHTVAVARFSTGTVTVLRYDEGQWGLLGNSILYGSHAGRTIIMTFLNLSLSSDGQTIVYRASATHVKNSNGCRDNYAKRRVYRLTDDNWQLIGGEIPFGGASVILSGDGTTVAFSDERNFGKVSVVKYVTNTSSWQPVGSEVVGPGEGDLFGSSLSLSEDGMTMAVGAKRDGNSFGIPSGNVRVYQFDGNDWSQVGQILRGVAVDDDFGASFGTVSLSADGSMVAVGAPLNDDNGTDTGHVRVYELVNDTWEQVGQTIVGFGEHVDLSDDARTLTAGKPFQAFRYSPNDGIWQKLGPLLEEPTNVALSGDGNFIVVGNSSSDAVYTDAGEVRVYLLPQN